MGGLGFGKEMRKGKEFDRDFCACETMRGANERKLGQDGSKSAEVLLFISKKYKFFF
jgi:hypothetical protein